MSNLSGLDSIDRDLEVATMADRSFLSVWKFDIWMSLTYAMPVSWFFMILGCLPAFWRPYVVDCLKLNDLKLAYPPGFLDLLGVRWGHPSFYPHWILVGACALLIFGLRYLDYRLRCGNQDCCSKQFLRRVEQGLAKIPKPVRSMLASHNYKIIAARQAISAVPFLLQESGDAFWPCYESVPAMCVPCSRTIVIGELEKKDNRWVAFEYVDLAGDIAHEIGHALDDCCGRLSKSQLFKEAHKADCGSMTQDERDMYIYLIQKMSDTGRGEAFAEIFRSVTTQPTEIERKFPLSSRVVRDMLIERKLIELSH